VILGSLALALSSAGRQVLGAGRQSMSSVLASVPVRQCLLQYRAGWGIWMKYLGRVGAGDEIIGQGRGG